MKKASKLIATALIILLFCTSAAFAATVPTDVAGASCEAAVSGLMEIGAVTGDTDGLFHPEANLTRAQVSKIIAAVIDPIGVAGTATQEASGQFSDLSGYSWAAGYIGYMAKNGIALGYGDNRFKPGNKVTVAELATFVVRACGYTDAEIGGTWPDNYMEKAQELGVLKDTAAYTAVSDYATKGMAAQMVYNVLETIQAFEGTPAEAQPVPQEGVPAIGSLTYATAAFDDNLTKYNNIALSESLTVYTYGLKKDYSSTMTLSQEKEDYGTDTVYKFKNTSTPAWYKVENGKITQIVLPKNVGFSGRVYCVINSTSAKQVNGENEKATAIETLTALQEVTWLTDTTVTGTIPSTAAANAGAFAGEIYELYVKNGEVREIGTATPGTHRGKMFDVTGGTVQEVSGNTVKINGVWYSMKANATVYELDKPYSEYEAGSLRSLAVGATVKAYDISDDDDVSFDMIVVKYN